MGKPLNKKEILDYILKFYGNPSQKLPPKLGKNRNTFLGIVQTYNLNQLKDIYKEIQDTERKTEKARKIAEQSPISLPPDFSPVMTPISIPPPYFEEAEENQDIPSSFYQDAPPIQPPTMAPSMPIPSSDEPHLQTTKKTKKMTINTTKLTDDIVMLQQKNLDYSQKIQLLEAGIKELQDAYSQLDDEGVQKDSQIDSLQQQLRDLEMSSKARGETTEDIETYRSGIVRLREESDELIKAYNELKEGADRNREKLVKEQQANMMLNDENLRLKDENFKLTDMNRSLSSFIERIRAQQPINIMDETQAIFFNTPINEYAVDQKDTNDLKYMVQFYNETSFGNVGDYILQPIYNQIKREYERQNPSKNPRDDIMFWRRYYENVRKIHQKGSLPRPIQGRGALKIGKGIQIESDEKFKHFGKNIIDISKLKKNILSIRTSSNHPIPNLESLTITNELKDFFMDLLDTGKFQPQIFDRLNDTDKSIFLRYIEKSNLMDKFQLRDEEKDTEMDRFNFLRGAFISGNNAPEIIQELKTYLIRFINKGYVRRGEGLNLLMELSVF